MLPKRSLNLLFCTKKVSSQNSYRSNFNLDDTVSSEEEILASDCSLSSESSVVYDSSFSRSYSSNKENQISISCFKKVNKKNIPEISQGFEDKKSEENIQTAISLDHSLNESADVSCVVISDSDTENEQEDSLNSVGYSEKDVSGAILISSNNSSRISNISCSSASSLSHSEIEMKLQKNKKILQSTNVTTLPDKGKRIQNNIQYLEKLLSECIIDDIKLPENQNSFEIAEQETEKVKVDLLTDKDEIISDMKTAIESELLKKASNPIIYKKNVDPFHTYSLREAYIGAKKEDGTDNFKKNFPANNYGGKLSEKNEQHMVRLTSDAVESLHKMLESIPNVEVEEEDDPDGLLVNLLPHQKKALTWLLWRESQQPQGGILADDMGLGKTLTMLSLILREKETQNSAKQNTQEELEIIESTSYFKNRKLISEIHGKENLSPSSGTLIVCPASLIGQWENEVKVRIQRKRLKILVYHGSNREIPLRRLTEYDLIITTYQQVMQEGSKIPRKNSRKSFLGHGPLFQILWYRIILDEAHQIRNYKSKTAEAAYLLQSKRRWAITGTPVQNKEMDFYSLIRFLRVSPFDYYTCWKHEIQTSTPQGQRKLALLVRALVLRRTKVQVDQITGKKIIDLPPKETVIHEIDLSQEEREVYDQVFAFSRKSLIQYMKMQENIDKDTKRFFGAENNSRKEFEESLTPTLLPNMLNQTEFKIHHMLVLLLRLRQICDHPGLVHAILEVSNDLPALPNDNELIEQMNSLALTDNQDIKDLDICIKKKILNTNNPVFQFKNPSSKIAQLVKELEILNKEKQEEKAVIVSQWTSMLDIISKHLESKGIRFTSITGQIPVKERGGIVKKFNIRGKDPKVLLLSLAAGGVGLNLVGANHLFLCDIHWNPQLESQACDRIYRVGQTLPVTIHKFVVMNSVEEKILELQKKKLNLADVILTGAKISVSNKLSLQDLKALFSV